MKKKFPYLKLMTPILFGGILVFAVLVMYVSQSTYKREQQQIMAYSQAMMTSLVRSLEVKTAAIESVLVSEGHKYSSQYLNEKEVYGNLERMVRDNGFIHNAALDIWNEYQDHNPDAASSTYYSANTPEGEMLHGKIKVRNGDVPEDEMRCYREAYETGLPCWSQPYYDDIATRLYMVTCYQKCDGPGKMISADVEVTNLLRDIDSLQFYNNSRFYIVDANGETYTLEKGESFPVPELLEDRDLSSRDWITISKHFDKLGIDIVNLVPKNEIDDVLWQRSLVALCIFLLSLTVLSAAVHYKFRKAQENLAQSLKKSAQEEMALKKIEDELGIAAKIQMEMLSSPGKGVHLVDDEGLPVDIMTQLIPAKEVGGDLYEYRLYGHNLVFCVADVSGKGIPASVVMTKCCTLFHAYASANSDPDPAGMLLYMNSELCRGNKNSMFATMWAGVLDLRSGALRYSSAGHNHPVLFSDEVSLLDCPGGIPLGIFEDAVYTSAECRLSKGEGILLYTDGITEAEGPGNVLFGDEALLQACRESVSRNPQVICANVLKAVREHSAGCTQSDDITLLSLTWAGRFSQIRSIDEVEALHTFAEECGAGYRTALALEELGVNAFEHGGATFVGTEFSDGAYTMVDDGGEFDPTSYQIPEDDDLQVNGRGIGLVRSICPTLEYRREGIYNITRLKVQEI